MFDKYSVNVDADLFKRFVEAIERIAPPPTSSLPVPEPSGEEDVISLDDEEYDKKNLQWQLDDLVESLSASGAEANADEIAKLQALKGRLADPENVFERTDD